MTGGLGSLGLLTAGWLAGQGHHHITLLGRTGRCVCSHHLSLARISLVNHSRSLLCFVEFQWLTGCLRPARWSGTPEGILASAIDGTFGGSLTLTRCDTSNRSEVKQNQSMLLPDMRFRFDPDVWKVSLSRTLDVVPMCPVPGGEYIMACGA